MLKLIIPFAIILIAFFFILIINIRKISSIEEFLESLQPSALSITSKEADMKLFNSELDKVFNIVIYRFITSGIEFKNRDGEVIKTIGKLNYRKTLESIYLNETVDFISEYESDGTTIKYKPTYLKNLIIENVYTTFIAKTSKSIKNMYYKYYSGYDVETYFAKKRGKPSLLPYITEYINGKICILYTEMLANDQRIFDEIQQNARNADENVGYSSKYTSALNDWSEKKFTELSLLIYNIYGSSDDLPEILKGDKKMNIKSPDGGKEE